MPHPPCKPALRFAFATALIPIATLAMPAAPSESQPAKPSSLKLFLAGDVMTGRGIDQIFPNSCDPRIHESYMKDARGYVEIAEQANGPIPRDVVPSYVWGDGFDILRAEDPDFRIINLETAVTTSDRHWPCKGIHYRMHPANADALQAAQIDVCALANNHVLDWGFPGLQETIATLKGSHLGPVGAGDSLAEATAPAALLLGQGQRLLVFSCGLRNSGIPLAWAAGPSQAGVFLLHDAPERAAELLLERIQSHATPQDLVLVSIHWGGNWGYDVPAHHRELAHRLIDAGVDLIHGHSSHHPMGIEVYRQRLILYGAGDLINDYEGIGGYEPFKPDLCLMYFPQLDRASGRLLGLRMAPMRIRKFQLQRAPLADAQWLANRLDQESDPLGPSISLAQDHTLTLAW